MQIGPSCSNTACKLGPCTHSYSSTSQQAILAPRENSSGGDESGKGQTPSPAVKSRPTSSEDDGSCGEGHSGGDSTDDVFVYDGVGVSDGLDDLDGIPQEEN